jgi:hypothetical protein
MGTLVEIQNCERMLLQAIKENNISLLDKLLHDDLLFVDPTGKIITKAMDLANYSSGQITIEHIAAFDQTIHLINNTAVVTVKVELKGKYLEHVLDQSFQYIRVWMQFEENWKIIAGSGLNI